MEGTCDPKIVTKGTAPYCPTLIQKEQWAVRREATTYSDALLAASFSHIREHRSPNEFTKQ
jgi:hypothetical protein